MRISDWSSDVCSSELPDESMAYGVHPVLRSVSHELVGRIEVELPPPGVDDFGLHDVLGSDGVELPDNQRIGHRVCGINLSAVQGGTDEEITLKCFFQGGGLLALLRIVLAAE